MSSVSRKHIAPIIFIFIGLVLYLVTYVYTDRMCWAVMPDEFQKHNTCSTISSGGKFKIDTADKYAEDSTKLMAMTIAAMLSTVPAISFIFTSCFVSRPSSFFGKWFRILIVVSALVFSILGGVTIAMGLSAFNKGIDKIRADKARLDVSYKSFDRTIGMSHTVSIIPAADSLGLQPEFFQRQYNLSVMPVQLYHKAKELLDESAEKGRTYHHTRIALGIVAFATTAIGMLIAVLKGKAVQDILKTAKEVKQPYGGFVPYPAAPANGQMASNVNYFPHGSSSGQFYPAAGPIYPVTGQIYQTPVSGPFYPVNGQLHPAPLGQQVNGQLHPAPLGQQVNGQLHPAPPGQQVNGQLHPAPLGQQVNGQLHPAPLGQQVNGQSVVAIGQPCEPGVKQCQV